MASLIRIIIRIIKIIIIIRIIITIIKIVITFTTTFSSPPLPDDELPRSHFIFSKNKFICHPSPYLHPTTSFAAIIIKTRVVLDDDEYGDDGLLLILMRIKNLQLNHPLGALWSP